MYRKNSKSWIKHWDFILLDLICLQVAFLLSDWTWQGMENPYLEQVYRNMAIIIELIDFCVILFYGTMDHVLKRGYYKEFAITLKHTILVLAAAALYLFVTQEGVAYSRMTLFLMIIYYFVITYVVRIFWKRYLLTSRRGTVDRSLLLITWKDLAEDTIRNFQEENRSTLQISGIAVLDAEMTGERIGEIPVVADADSVTEYVCREWVDEVFLRVDHMDAQIKNLMDELMLTGVTMHISLVDMTDYTGRQQFTEQIGGYTVLTSSMNTMTTRQAIIKRAMDIAGGLVGCVLTGIIFIFVAPAIYKNSPGPIFFKQERVGRNGKKFKMYKFRSMYPDAEERKEQYMKENRVKDGMMFKLDFDPRVIGNEILPDGTKKTGIGDFLRRTSLDEFPQFFNVLKGEMSLVGTRPPTLDEWEKYDLHHRARLAIKPGITGMWQVSGRSDISDFEEVVRLDTQYINEWSLGLDIKILLKTVKNVLHKEGAR